MKYIIITLLLSLAAAIQAAIPMAPAQTLPPLPPRNGSVLKKKPALADYAGNWVVIFSNGNERVYEITTLGRVTFDDVGAGRKAKLVAKLTELKTGGYVLDFKEGKVETVVLEEDGTLTIQHWDNPVAFKIGKDANLTAVGKKFVPRQ